MTVPDDGSQTKKNMTRRGNRDPNSSIDIIIGYWDAFPGWAVTSVLNPTESRV